MKEYQVRMQQFQYSQQFGPNVNYLDWFNQGSTNVYINGRLLLPLTGYAVPTFPGETDRTSYEIVFDNNEASGNLLVVTMKSYM